MFNSIIIAKLRRQFLTDQPDLSKSRYMCVCIHVCMICVGESVCMYVFVCVYVNECVNNVYAYIVYTLIVYTPYIGAHRAHKRECLPFV